MNQEVKVIIVIAVVAILVVWLFNPSNQECYSNTGNIEYDNRQLIDPTKNQYSKNITYRPHTVGPNESQGYDIGHGSFQFKDHLDVEKDARAHKNVRFNSTPTVIGNSAYSDMCAKYNNDTVAGPQSDNTEMMMSRFYYGQNNQNQNQDINGLESVSMTVDNTMKQSLEPIQSQKLANIKIDC
ncbi:MAG: hypothetical protein Dasosvirus9_11 [Dasosvirus sp.]|uniref:Uncharacterized protein n=1 Tax=Dasosvirus sp. TaxID=2487764 RepID=A0A3G4ZRR3_9VIRU|nr:MAG: hypothetical protein Dasosvirus9_11 [Dasosvirus sp.]